MRKVSIFIAACMAASICSVMSVHAQDVSFQNSRLDRNPATVAMGGVSLGMGSSDAYAAYGNIAAAPMGEKRGDVAASYMMWSPSSELLKSNAFSAGAMFKAGSRVAIALAGNYDTGFSYEMFDDYGISQGMFKTGAYGAALGLGVKIIDCLSIGVNAHFAGEKIAADYKPLSVGADAYLMFTMKGFTATAGVASMGASFGKGVGSGEGESRVSLPSSVRAGVGYSRVFGGRHSVTFADDFDYYLNGSISDAIGAQYAFNDMLFVRAGYRFAYDSPVPSFFSCGLGVKFSGVHIDAAYLTGKTCKNSLCVGLGYTF